MNILPKLGFGTFTLNGQACKDAVQDALAIGYRHIDTARMYGNEKEVGQGIRNYPLDRSDLFLTTKLWYDELKHEQVLQSTHDSLKSLGTDYVDLLLIHWPSPEGIPLEETLTAMQQLKEEGKVHHIGVSNFPPSLFQEALNIAPIFCNQVEYHPFLSQQSLLEIAKEHQVWLTAYCPLAKGKVPKDPMLKSIGEKYGKNPAQVALKWLLQQTNVAAIPRSSKHHNRASNFDIIDFELTPEEMESIHHLARNDRQIDPSFGPDWEL